MGFSHDGKYVSTADMSGLIQVWRVDNSQLIQSYETSDLEVGLVVHSANMEFTVLLVDCMARTSSHTDCWYQ